MDFSGAARRVSQLDFPAWGGEIFLGVLSLLAGYYAAPKVFPKMWCSKKVAY